MQPSRPNSLARFAPIFVALAVWIVWAFGMAAGDRWHLFATEWFMSVTMMFGSFVAGATSEGGGAVAFPVMTLLFHIEPHVARDFSLMIQTVGMGSATIAILALRIRVERHAVLWASVGGTLGVVLGLEYVAPRVEADFAKTTFLSVWLAFAFALYWINRYHDREVKLEIEGFLPRHALLLACTGVLGGVISSITGSGLDIVTFSLLVLRLRICERVATPTSVVLMAVNAAVGFAWKGSLGGGLAPEAWSYWWVCVPIVTVGAPFGARFIRDRSRHFVAGLLYVAIGAQFLAGLFVIEQTAPLVGYSVAVFAAGLLLFHRMAAGGVRRLEWLADEPG
ncbi:MAG: sulfite exporter TauE/SafE family protein [Planctomycetota bacterium]